MQNDEIKRLDFSGWPLPDEYLIEIGRVSAMWAALEAFLNVCLGKLAGFDQVTDERPFILVTHASVPQRLDMLSALCEHLSADYPRLAEHKNVVAKIKSAQASRNKFSHHVIGFDATSGKATIAIGSARGKIKASVQTIEVTDIRRATIEISDAQTALYKLVLGKELPPAWQRRSQPS